MNLVDLLLPASAPDGSEALNGRGGRVTRGDLRRDASRVARLVEEATRPGDRVAMAADGPMMVAAYLGVLAAGRTVVLLDRDASAENLADRVALVDPAAFICQKGARAKLPDLGIPVLDEDAVAAAGTDGGLTVVETGADDPALILLTSGSTGAGKGVVLSHRNLIANTRSIIEYMGLTADDRACSGLPLHYSYGLSILNTHLAVGGALVTPNPMFVGSAVETIEKFGCTNFSGVPTTYATLVCRTDFLYRRFSTLRFITQAGGRMSPELVDQLRAGLPGVRVLVMYGQTEASPRLSHLPHEDWETRRGSIGRGIPGVELRVLDPDGRPVPPGGEGEVVARGENIMLGYFRDPEATARAVRDGALWTGDRATVDADGYIYLLSRNDDIMKSAGFRFHPREIEDVIASDPEVEMCVVVGIDDEARGSVPVAFAQMTRSPIPEGAAERLTALARSRLPTHMQPARIVPVESLPRMSSGKPDRRALLERARRGE